MRGFDPEQNTASGNPPELDNDRLVSRYSEHIAKDRGILKDLALIGRDLLAQMPAFRVIADTEAAKDMDAGVRNAVSVGGDSLENVSKNTTDGTIYEGAYGSDSKELVVVDAFDDYNGWNLSASELERTDIERLLDEPRELYLAESVFHRFCKNRESKSITRIK